MASRGLRAAERHFARKAGLLLTSSPAFVEHYFKPLSGVTAPVHLVENRVLALDGPAALPPRAEKPAGEPWRIGWFGAIRCRRSLDLLSAFTRRMEGRFEVVLRGRPARSEFEDFDGLVARGPFLRFEGPYRNPEDLAAIYRDIDFAWAIDFFEEGLNSAWLLPNRLYESCRHGALPIVLEGTETARLAGRRGIGIALRDARLETLVTRFSAFDDDSHRAQHAALAELGPKPWIHDQADCAALVQRLAALRAPDPAPIPSLLTSKVDCHDH
jgi:succinoglycan biosynthesis protein ExoL